MDGDLKVLLVEEDAKQATLVENSLRNFNPRFQIDSALADTCLKRISETHYEAIILDLQNLEQERSDLLKQLALQTADTPVVVVAEQNGTHTQKSPENEMQLDYVVRDSRFLNVLPQVVQRNIESHRLRTRLRGSSPQEDLQDLILRSKRRLQSLFDGIQDTLYEVDLNYNIVLVNRKFADHCNAKPENLIGKKCYEVFFNFKEPCTECPARTTFKNWDPFSLERRIGDRIYEMSSHPILTNDGNLGSVAVHSKDVTEKKLIERSLIQSEKLATIGLLASGIAHELRNPLNIIETARYYIDEFLPGNNPDIKEKLDIIRKNVQRSSKIINGLLEFSRHSNGERAHIDLQGLMDSTVALIGKELDAKHIEFSVNRKDKYLVKFSIDSLKQVLLNIIINAIQAMPQGGKLNVDFADKPEFTEIMITDTGVGIPEEDLPHLFSPFFTTKEVGEGTGLGLYISHIILDREGGKITVASKVGKGTTFTLSIPKKTSEE